MMVFIFQLHLEDCTNIHIYWKGSILIIWGADTACQRMIQSSYPVRLQGGNDRALVPFESSLRFIEE